jgi:two-component system NtrC family response regulator
LIDEGRFREDLFYRISEVELSVPALRERPGDASLIAQAFLGRFCAEHGLSRIQLTPEARAAIDDWQWPGNVRELENRVKRAVILCEHGRIVPEDLELPAKDTAEPHPLNLREIREKAEVDAVRRALASTANNVSGAARLLGVSRPTLYDLMHRYGLSTAVD